MRFDYQSPLTQIRFLRLRHQFNLSLIAVGVFCIVLALTPHSQQNKLKPSYSIPIPKTTSSPIKEDIASTARLEQPTWKSVRVNRGDSLSKIFFSIGLSETELHNILASHPASKQLTRINPGDSIDFLLDINNEFQALRYNLSPGKTLHIHRLDEGYKLSYQERQLEKKISYASNVIQDSLFAAAQDVGLKNKTIMQLADIFGWDIDFALDIRQGDSFKVLFEEKYLDGEKIATGNILAAEFKNQGQVYQAIRYTDKTGRTRYYSPEGYSMHKAFLRTPVNFTRISSHFNTGSKGRHHPILHKLRAHKGVDYAAPLNTPIRASGDGKVAFLGTKGGYGKAIILQHGHKYSTLYGHLSRFAKNLKAGQQVKQGDVIGYVGKTGLATGYHLHYEFRINGIHQNPLTVKLPKALPIQKADQNQFLAHANQLVKMLATFEQHQLAKAD